MTANLRWPSYENKFDVCAHTEGMYEYGMLSVEHTHTQKKPWSECILLQWLQVRKKRNDFQILENGLQMSQVV